MTKLQMADRVSEFLADGPAFQGISRASIAAMLMEGARMEHVKKMYANITALEDAADEFGDGSPA